MKGGDSRVLGEFSTFSANALIGAEVIDGEFVIAEVGIGTDENTAKSMKGDRSCNIRMCSDKLN